MNYVTLEDYPYYRIYKNSVIIRIQKQSKNGKKLRRRVITPTKAKNGYRTVRLYNKDGVMKQFYLHRLIWEAFNGEIPEGYEIDHINGMRSGKDANGMDANDVQNLRCVTHKMNCFNPRSLERFRFSNSLDKGKFDREKMIAAQGKRNHDRLVRLYKRLVKKHGCCGIWMLMHEGHCGYPKAKQIMNEMKGKNDTNH